MSSPPPIDRAVTAAKADQTPERFEPNAMRGGLVEAEHLTRYRFAASVCGGREVLDAACGWGYGSELLLRGGAKSVTGVDIAESVIDAAGAANDSRINFLVGDIESLPFANDSFDVVVCFEAIEHVEGWARALDEFARVLRPGGQLVISTPNDSAYGDRNEHHIHQFTRAEFSLELGNRFANVELFAQSPWVVSIVSDLAVSEAADLEIELPATLKTTGAEAGSEIYLIAIASNSEVAMPGNRAVMTSPVELFEWIKRWEAQDAYLQDLRDELGSHRSQEAATLRAEVLRLNELLVERELAVVNAQREVAEAQRGLSRMHGATSWRVTAPFRNNRLLRKLTGRS